MPLRQEEITAKYNLLYRQELEAHPHGDASAKERHAQKFAIKEAAQQLFVEHPTEPKADIWDMIYAAHVARKSGIEVTPEMAEKVISADQSWKKSSGHAFEELVKDACNQALLGTDASVLLQKDVKGLFDRNELLNEAPDLPKIRYWLSDSSFDLYAIKDRRIFGCIQAKTSIRDRVTRDREPSLQAMGSFFWSIAFVLDGDFLRLPKFKNMVNGRSESYPLNGWHGMYAFGLPVGASSDRIYQLDRELEPFRSHAAAATAAWEQRRQWFTNEWMP